MSKNTKAANRIHAVRKVSFVKRKSNFQINGFLYAFAILSAPTNKYIHKIIFCDRTRLFCLYFNIELAFYLQDEEAEIKIVEMK